MRGLQIRTGLALLIHLLAEGEDDHIVVECLRVQPHPEHDSMHMHRLRAVGAASHTCPTLLQLLGIFHKVFLDSVGVIDGMLSGRLARVRVQATLK